MKRSKSPAADLFERQYGEALLQYQESFPRLRHWLRPWLCDRFSVTSDIVANLCSTPARRRLLDFGCGDGRQSRLAAYRAPAGLAEIVGVDLSASRIAQAQARAATRPESSPLLHFIAGDETGLESLKGDGFDIVLCIAVFGQVYDLYDLGRRLCDVLRPGGHLVAEFANYAYIRRRLAFLRGRLPTVSSTPIRTWPQIGWDAAEVHYFTRKTCVEFVQQLGLVVSEIHSTGLLANVFRFWSGLLATGFVVVARKPDS